MKADELKMKSRVLKQKFRFEAQAGKPHKAGTIIVSNCQLRFI